MEQRRKCTRVVWCLGILGCLGLSLMSGCGEAASVGAGLSPGPGSVESNTGGDGARPLQEPTLAQVQSEISALTAPDGFDPVLFADLKQALSSALTRQTGNGVRKLAADLPTQEDNAVDDLDLQSIAGSDYLVWTHRSVGDYDQNGEVGAADLVPIALYYGATPASANWAQARVADGDSNTEVGSADIVPIAQHFGTTLAGYSIYGTPDQGQPWFPLGYMSLQDARDQQIAGSEGSPLKFSFPIPAEPQYLSFYVAPSDTVNDGIGSNEVTISTEPPGITGAGPQAGISGDLVEFIPEVTGSLLTYAWDFGGGAEPNTSSFAHPLVTLGAPGEYTVNIEVDNKFGDPASFQFTLTVEEKQGDPVDVYTVSPWGGSAGNAVTFTADVVAGTEPFTYAWDFGGGANPNTSTDASPTVTLLGAGFYEASVTVDNAYGDPDVFEFIMTVD